MISKKIGKLVIAKFKDLATFEKHQHDEELKNALTLTPIRPLIAEYMGQKSPIMTPLIDWVETEKVSPQATKSNGVYTAFMVGFDDIHNKGLYVILKKPFKEFDKVMICITSDEMDSYETRVYDAWEIDFILSQKSIKDVGVYNGNKNYWYFAPYTSSDKKRLLTSAENCGIIEIYGLSYPRG